MSSPRLAENLAVIIQNFLDGIRFVFLFSWTLVQKQEILVFGFAILLLQKHILDNIQNFLDGILEKNIYRDAPLGRRKSFGPAAATLRYRKTLRHYKYPQLHNTFTYIIYLSTLQFK